MRYSIIAARDGDIYHDEIFADDIDKALSLARKQLAEAWNMQDTLQEFIDEGDEEGFDGELDGFAVDPDPEDDNLQLYRKLADGLRELLAKIAGKDPGLETSIEAIRAEFKAEAECFNCGWNGGEEELNPIKDFHSRVEAGDSAVPAGECPVCCCLAYLKDEEQEEPDFSAQREACGLVNDLGDEVQPLRWPLDEPAHVPGLNAALASKGDS